MTARRRSRGSPKGRAASSRRWAVVTIAALDLRKRVGHGSELGSQLLAGELAQVERRSPDGLWWRLRGPDGYPGWARAWGLAPLSEREAAGWRRRATARVRVPYTVVRSGPGRGMVVSPAYLHARFVPLETRGRWRAVLLPGGGRGWIERRHLVVGRARRPALRQRIQQLLGTPYLWGGRTAMGLDCSGFVQMVLMDDGGVLPRDAHEQWLAVRKLPIRASARAGDLVFFDKRGGRVGHVGIMVDSDTFAHARGSVRLSSFDTSSRLYDKELSESIRGFGRPRRRTR